MTKDLVTCPIENTLRLINRKWVILLIRDMFNGKKHFFEFKESNPDLANNVLSDTLKFMENNDLVEKKTFENVNRKSTEYHLTEKGSRLNNILYEMAVFGLDELECGDEGDIETIKLFKDYYRNLLNIRDYDESSSFKKV